MARMMMRLDKGQLSDPTGALRYPPHPQARTGWFCRNMTLSWLFRLAGSHAACGRWRAVTESQLIPEGRVLSGPMPWVIAIMLAS